MFSNTTHVLHEVTAASLGSLCSNIIGKAEWNLNHAVSKPPLTLSHNILFFSIPKSDNEIMTLHGLSYSCDDFIIVKGLSFFVGPRDFTVILAEGEPNTQHYKIIALVTNVYTELLNYIF